LAHYWFIVRDSS